jgi:hypothetical protein
VQLRSWFTSLVAGLGLLLTVSATQAAPLPVGGGWQFDTLTAANTPSTNSPWTFTLSAPGVFSIVDCCAPGDVLDVFDVNGLVLTTSFALATTYWTPTGDSADFEWVNTNYSRGQVLLPAGSYAFSIFSNAIFPGGFTAGLSVRADLLQTEVVPAPAALGLFGLGLLGLAAVRRRA